LTECNQTGFPFEAHFSRRVVATDIALVNVNLRLGPGTALDQDRADVRFKPEESRALKNAVKSATTMEFLS
jgi:hypothetical protein